MNKININKDFMNDISIRKKLIFAYVLCVLIPLLFIGTISSMSMRKMAVDQTVKEAQIDVYRVEQRVHDAMNVAIDLSNKFYSDRNLENVISQRYEKILDLIKSYEQYTEIDACVRTFKEVENICVYAKNDTLIDGAYFKKVTDEIIDEKWYQNAVDAKGKISWEYINLPSKNQKCLALTRLISVNRYNAVLVIYIRNSFLNSIVKQESFETMIINEDGNIISSNKLSNVSINIKQMEKFPNIENVKIAEGDYNKKRSKIIVNNMDTTGGNKYITIIAIFPLDSILARVQRISTIGFFMIFIALLTALILIIMFSEALSQRIQQLSNDVHTVALGILDYGTEITGKDEIGFLAKDINIMVDSLKGLIQDVYISNLQKQELIIKQKEIEFKMLSNQINPHFLFNALETIRMKAHCSGDEETANAVKLLGKLMRGRLEISDNFVTIESEIDFVNTYLKIQKFRFEDKINFNIEVEDDIIQYKIPSLTIQPIVENAVIHGLENKEGKGNILVNIRKCKYKNKLIDIIKISVQDDGVGMNEEKLIKIKESLSLDDEKTNSGSIGIRNVHQRIKLYYGDDYGLNIFSEIDKGTTIEIILPINQI